MAEKLTQILYVDDNKHDRELVRDALEKEHEGFKLYEAASGAEFKKMLKERDYDLILSDFHILGFEGLQVLEIVKSEYPHLPVILVTGTGSEEVAVEAMKRGAADYVLKSPSHIQRLPQSIHAVLETKLLEEKQVLAAKALEESEIRYRRLFEAAMDGILILDAENGKILDVNPYLIKMLGYKLKELLGKTLWEISPFKDIASNKSSFNRLKEKEYVRYENLPLESKSGKSLEVEFVSNVYEADGKKVVQCNIRDITERMRAKQALRDAEIFKQAIISHSPIGISVRNPLGELQMANAAWLKIWGYSEEDYQKLLQERYETFYFDERDESLGENQEDVRRIYEKGGSLYLPDLKVVKRKKSKTEWVSQYYYAITNDMGQVAQVVALTEDVTERKQAERSAIKRAEELAALQETIMDITTYHQLPELLSSLVERSTKLLNADGGGLYLCNPERQEVRCEVSYKTPEDYTGVVLPYGQGAAGYVAKTGKPLIVDDYRKWSGRADVYANSDPFRSVLSVPILWQGKVTGVIHSLRYTEGDHFNKEDLELLTLFASHAAFALENAHLIEELQKELSDRIQAEKKIIESETKYRSLFNNVPDGIYSTSTDGRILAANPALVKMFGCESLEDLQKENAYNFYSDPGDRDKALRQVDELGEAHNIEVTFRRKDGSSFIGIENSRAIIDQDGKIMSYEGTLTDITDRKLTEDALRESENRFRTTLENMELIAIQLDKEGKITYANPYFIKLSGYSREELIGRDWSSTFIPVPLRTELKQYLYDSLFNENVEYQHENPILLRDGTERLIHWNNSLMNSSGGNSIGMTSIGEDITDKKASENAILRQLNELTVLKLVSEASSKAANSDDLIADTTHIISTSLYPDNCGVLLYNQETRALTPHYSYIGVTEDEFQDTQNIIIPLGKGIAGRVAANLEPINIPDVHKDANYININKETHSELCVPISINDKLLGVINTESKEMNAFSENDERLLMTIAGNLATALEKLRLYEETSRQLEFVKVLRKIDMSISSSLDLHPTLQIILEQVLKQLRVDAADILLLNPHSQLLNYQTGLGFRTNVLQYTMLPLGEGLAGKAALERKIIQIPDLSKDQGVMAKEIRLANEDFISYLSVPLISKGMVKGVLEIFSRTSLSPGQEWLEQVEILARQAAIAIDNISLYDDLQSSNQELVLAYDATIVGWSKALDLRDQETEGHTQRAVETTLKIARKLNISDHEMVHIRRGALLHDIGKMGIPDDILRKPGSLSEEEWEIMHKHPQYAFEMLAPISYLKPAIDIPYCHHEKWDGSGYPRGLKGEMIPLSARIFAVVDVYDALTSDRPYRKAWTREKAIAYIREQSGNHFDPQVVDVFLELIVDI